MTYDEVTALYQERLGTDRPGAGRGFRPGDGGGLRDSHTAEGKGSSVI